MPYEEKRSIRKYKPTTNVEHLFPRPLHGNNYPIIVAHLSYANQQHTLYQTTTLHICNQRLKTHNFYTIKQSGDVNNTIETRFIIDAMFNMDP